jgi:hypothetical protein
MIVLHNRVRVAAKQHQCDLCLMAIPQGKKYKYSFIIEGGDSWSFRAHLHCDAIMNYLYKWFDAPEGVTNDDFCDLLPDYCQDFVCPHCEHSDKDEDENAICSKDKEPMPDCLERMADRLSKYALIREKNKRWREVLR